MLIFIPLTELPEKNNLKYETVVKEKGMTRPLSGGRDIVKTIIGETRDEELIGETVQVDDNR